MLHGSLTFSRFKKGGTKTTIQVWKIPETEKFTSIDFCACWTNESLKILGYQTCLNTSLRDEGLEAVFAFQCRSK